MSKYYLLLIFDEKNSRNDPKNFACLIDSHNIFVIIVYI